MKDDHRKYRKLHPLSARRMGAKAVLDKANHRTDLVRQRDAANATANVADPAHRPLYVAESRRLTREIASIPNVGRAVRRSFARRLATAKVRPVYPLPVATVTERSATWVTRREEDRRVRQMTRGDVLSA